ncbi:MAG: ABC transporter permease, partial [Bryobacterales bacterium]|nr:ABC transporter permease [Bryobacterales bacterium]
VAAMGFGIGASTILFALVHTALLRPLPYPEPERLVRVFDRNPSLGLERAEGASGNIATLQQRSTRFTGIAGYFAMGRTLSTAAGSEVLLTAQVSRDFFSVLGTPPLVGNTFTEEETERATFNSAAAPTGVDPVVILSHGVWQRWFGGDRSVIGQTVTLERRPYRVVGVMPASFAMPSTEVGLWIPWGLRSSMPRDQHYVNMVGRLKPGVSLHEADQELARLSEAMAAEHPATNKGWSTGLMPLAEDIAGGSRRVLLVLLGAVGLVLLVACGNVALLSIARNLERSREDAIRLAVGGTASRLLQQFLVESFLLAIAGGILGACVAAAGIRILPMLALDLPRLHELRLDPWMPAFAFGVTLLAGLVSGLPPALLRTRLAPAQGLHGARAGGDRGGHRLRDVLAVAEVALATLLLAGSGLLVKSFLNLRSMPSGFEPRNVLVAPVFLDMQAYGGGGKVQAYYDALFEKLRGLPGVTSVGAATTLPASPLGPDFARPIWPEVSVSVKEGALQASVRMVTPDYFRTLGYRLVEGRVFRDSDRLGSPQVVMLSERLARRLWPKESPIGTKLVVDYSTAGTYPYEITGVVNDVRFRGPRSDVAYEIYFPHAQRPYLVLNVAMKTEGDPLQLAGAVREAMRGLDAQKPAQGIYALQHLFDATMSRDRMVMFTVTLFASIAILLSALSLYGVLSYRVSSREQEIAIRLAVGASRRQLMQWVASYGFRLTVCGVAAGVVLTIVSSRWLGALLYGVSATDGPALGGVAAVLVCLGVLVSLLPAVQAMRVDPIRAIRRG